MDALITLCGDIPLSTVILTIVAIVFLIKVGKKVYKEIALSQLSEEELDNASE